MNKLIIFAGPSGAGKSTIVKHLLAALPDKLSFSISATTRSPRPGEENGREYHFISVEDFKEKINKREFIEFEEVYKDTFYGTLMSEIDRIGAKGCHVIFDIDVKGALNIKSFYGKRALAIVVLPPSLEVLAERLRGRGTESPEKLQQRLDKAELELSLAPQFDASLVNDDLDISIQEALSLVKDFIE